MTQCLEYCTLCDEPTGRAGRGDDSIYCTLIRTQRMATGRLLEEGNEVGPLCWDCKQTLLASELIDDE